MVAVDMVAVAIAAVAMVATAMLVVAGEATWEAAGEAARAAAVLDSSATGAVVVPALSALAVVAAFPRIMEEMGTTRLTL
jgi:hypothetical protein